MENQSIDLVLMDIKMPIMDGHSATKIIQAIRQYLPIIAQTAYADEKDKEQFLESGFDDFICKPISVEAFYLIMDKFVAR